MTIFEHSKSRIGHVWTDDDDFWLTTQILKMEFLFEECMRSIYRAQEQSNERRI